MKDPKTMNILKEVEDGVIRIGELIAEEVPKHPFQYQAVRKICNEIGIKEMTGDKYYLFYLCYLKGIRETLAILRQRNYDISYTPNEIIDFVKEDKGVKYG